MIEHRITKGYTNYDTYLKDSEELAQRGYIRYWHTWKGNMLIIYYKRG